MPACNEKEIKTISDRFVKHFLFGPTDRPPYWEIILFWNDTIKRWENERFPKGMSGEEYFDMEALYWIPEIPITWIPFSPSFEEKLIEDHSDYRIIRNFYMIIFKEYKKGESIPQFLEFLVKERKSWEKLKWRLDATNPDRYIEIKKKEKNFNSRKNIPRNQKKRSGVSPLSQEEGFYDQ